MSADCRKVGAVLGRKEITVMIRVGDVVRLRRGVFSWCCDRKSVPAGREDNRTATVKALLTDVEGGLLMDRDLRGCRYWNVEDVEVVS